MNRPSASTESDVQASFCATLAAQWAALGVTAACIAPGSRSTPMVLALEAQSGITVDVFLDERSAAFAALGHGLSTGRPAVVVCTSGTAAAHLHAAVIEADLSRVPLIAVTADRPPELRDVGAPQTIDQTKLFGSAVRWFHDPGVAADSARHTWTSLAASIVHRTMVSPPGPVHLNLSFREPLVGNGSPVEGSERARRLHHAPASIDDVSLDAVLADLVGRRGVVLAGRGSPSARMLDDLGRAFGWPVLADSRAFDHASFVRHFDTLVRSGHFDDGRPEVVLRFGEPPASKVTAQWLAGTDAVHVGADASWYDADHRVIHRIHADPDRVAERLAAAARSFDDPTWRARWIDAEAIADRVVDDAASGASTPSGPLVTRRFVAALPPDAEIVVSSSMPVRDLEWFGGHHGSRRVHSNRGANGIDGVLATAIGVARATGRTTGVLLGDIAFVHDSSSLASLAARDVDLRILVTDNDGGGIFHYLPQATLLADATFEKLFGTPHGTDIVRLAEAHGLDTARVHDSAAVVERARRVGPSVTVVSTDRRTDQEVHRRLHDEVRIALTRRRDG